MNTNRRKYLKIMGLILLLGFSFADRIMGQPQTTFMLARESKDLEFACIGDPHYGWTNHQHAGEIVNEWMTNKTSPDISFAFNMGDFTHFGSAEGWKVAMQKSFNKMYLPWMFVFGNHDTEDYKTGTGRDLYGDAGGHASKKVYNRPYRAIIVGKQETGLLSRNYAFSWNNILFLVFGDMGNTSLLTQFQRDWLEYMTSKYPDQTTITVSHQALDGESTAPYRHYKNAQWWKNFIGHNPQIVLHINGHNHQFYHYKTFHDLDAIDTGRTNRENKYMDVIIAPHSIQARVWDVGKHSWQNEPLLDKAVETHVQNTGLNWYSAALPVQDGQKIRLHNKMLAKNYKLEFVGRGPELVEQNRCFDYWGDGGGGGPLQWIGYEQDDDNGDHAGYVEFAGVDTFATATTPAMGFQSVDWFTKQPLDWFTKWIDGKVPDATTPLAIPGKKYTLRVRLKADKSVKNAMNVGIQILGQDLEKIIYDDPRLLENIDLTDEYKWFSGNFVVPDNQDAWIIKTFWISEKAGIKCYLDEWSITRTNASSVTKDFTVSLNGSLFKDTGDLSPRVAKQFDLQPEIMKNVLEISSQIKGSRTGFIRLIYNVPTLWSDDVSIGINRAVNSDEFECHFDLVSNYAENISLYPLQPFVQVVGAAEQNVKDYYSAQILPIPDVPGNFRVKVHPENGKPSVQVIAFEITPNNVKQGQPIQATIMLANHGQSTGFCELIHTQDNLLVETRKIAIKSGQNKPVQFTLKYPTPGEYQIQAGSFTKHVTVEK